MTAITVERASRHGPFAGRLEPQHIASYAAATADQTAAVLGGAAVPAVFPAALTFRAQEAANGDVPKAAWDGARGGVHGEHDIVLHRPLRRESRWTPGRDFCRSDDASGRPGRSAFEQVGGDGGWPWSSGGRWSCSACRGWPTWGRCLPNMTSPPRCWTTRSDGDPTRRSTRSPSVMPRYPGIGRRITSTSTCPGGRIRLLVRPRAVHHGDVHPPVLAITGVGDPGVLAGWRYVLLRRRGSVANWRYTHTDA